MKNGSICILNNKDGSTEKVRLIYYPVKGALSGIDFEEQFNNKFRNLEYEPLYSKHRSLNTFISIAIEYSKYLITPEIERLALVEPMGCIGQYRYVKKKYLTSTLTHKIKKLFRYVRNKR